MNSTRRIIAIASKEWRLNSRFPLEYFAANLVSPLKSAVLMFFIYRGLLKNSGQSLGLLNGGNYQSYVFLGTTCHSLFMASVYTFRSKMVMEKYWQTVTATLISPATVLELILGFMIGSGAINLLISGIIFALTTLFFPVSITTFLGAMGLLLMLSFLGFGFGMIGTTISLCWEGKSFVFDYLMQAIIFLSCFYYPIETLPKPFHGFVECLPTYQVSHMIQTLFLANGSNPLLLPFGYVTITCFIVLIIPAFFFDFSIKKFGIVGY
jgi:ABC-type polysaccharide/polyol phosphate export permease